MLGRGASALVGLRGEPIWVRGYSPHSLPQGWTYREPWGLVGGVYDFRKAQLMVIFDGDVMSDGRRWLHVSMSHPDHLPSWEEVREVKDIFIGRDRYAIQVLPPEARYVNIHNYVMHLFSCVDGHPLPEFSGIVGGRRSL